MWKSQDLSGLLLLYTSIGNPKGLEKLGGEALESGRYNIGFMCLLLLGRINGCIDLLVKAKRLPEAAFMARSYAPSRVSGVLAEWYVDHHHHSLSVSCCSCCFWRRAFGLCGLT